MLAADGGTTVAIVIAVFTLIGTISANLVAYHKVRVDARTASDKQEHEREKSNVEVAQAVMAQTVQTLNERLQTEAAVYEAKLATLRAEKEEEIAKLKAQHAQDIKRLEAKVDELTKSYKICQENSKRLSDRLDALRKQGER